MRCNVSRIALPVLALLAVISLSSCLRTEVEVIGADESKRIASLPDGAYYMLEFKRLRFSPDGFMERKALEGSEAEIIVTWQEKRGEYLLAGSGVSRARAVTLGPDVFAVLVSEEGEERVKELYVLQDLGNGIVQLIPDDYPDPDDSLSVELRGHSISGGKKDIVAYLEAVSLLHSGSPGVEMILAHEDNFTEYDETCVKASKALLNLDGIWR